MPGTLWKHLRRMCGRIDPQRSMQRFTEWKIFAYESKSHMVVWLWAFEPNILYRIASFKRSLTHLLPSLAILQILMISISLDIAKTWKFHRLPAKFSNLGFKLVNSTSIYLLSLLHIIIRICLADFLKANLTKFAVIWVKKRQKAGFLSARSSKIIVTKKKERRKERARRREEGK